MNHQKRNLGCNIGYVTVLLVALISCKGENQSSKVSIGFSGAVYAQEAAEITNLKILSTEDQAVKEGISAELSKRIFATIIECKNSTTTTHFYCYNDAKCTKSCIVRSAKRDGSDERTEEKDSEDKVVYLPGRIYWCPCE